MAFLFGLVSLGAARRHERVSLVEAILARCQRIEHLDRHGAMQLGGPDYTLIGYVMPGKTWTDPPKQYRMALMITLQLQQDDPLRAG